MHGRYYIYMYTRSKIYFYIYYSEYIIYIYVHTSIIALLLPSEGRRIRTLKTFKTPKIQNTQTRMYVYITRRMYAVVVRDKTSAP